MVFMDKFDVNAFLLKKPSSTAATTTKYDGESKSATHTRNI
jgi:hypothetical protein